MNKIERIKKNYYDVIPAYNIDGTLIYSCKDKLKVGSLVVISIRKKKVVGCVLNLYKKKPILKFQVKDIEEVSNIFHLDKRNIDFFNWVSRYNVINLGLSFKLIISDPKFLNPKTFITYSPVNNYNSKLTVKQKHFLNILRVSKFDNSKKRIKAFSKSFINSLVKKKIVKKNINIRKSEIKVDLSNTKLRELSLSQNKVFKNILKQIKTKNSKPIYLDGVTGSGKTEVYFKVIRHILEENKQVLVLIPEIALGEQWIKRFYDAFKFNPLIWNSKINQSEKKYIWQAIVKGEKVVVVGARSSIFLPFTKLGLVIVDEENDISYKQEENPIYNARDMAIVKAKINLSSIILVSATPSLETFNNFINNKFYYFRLDERFGTAKDPRVFLIDMKKEKNKVFSDTTLKILKDKIKRNRQVLILINRRGYAPITICSKCGRKETCKNCDINLVYHQNKKQLICHHCGMRQQNQKYCKGCGEIDKKITLGFGIEKVTEIIKKEFNKIKVISLSSDNINEKKFSKVLEDIENAKIKIIIGTQIISKGFNFLNLSSIFILDFDLWFYNTDIRTNEKIFQLTQQVSGRTSRKSETGEVYIQTYDKENYLLNYIISNNRNKFYENELILRKKALLPPYCKLAAIIFISKDVKLLKEVSLQTKKNLLMFKELIVLGPIPAPIEYINKEYRYRLLIKTNHSFFVQKVLKSFNFNKMLRNRAKIKIDIDPLSFF